MNKIKAVIFDMDGLIVDTEELESISLSKIIEEYGKTPQLLDTGLVHVVGGAEKTYIDLMERHGIIETFEIFSNKKRDIFTTLLEQKLTPFDGLFPLIDLLKKNKIVLALASNRFEGHIHIILKNLRVTDHFSVIVGSNKERRHKPHPDIYLHTAKELNVKPEECVVLEDSETGVLSAKAAGMKIIAIPNKYTKEHDFSKADIITKSLADVNMEMLNSL